MECHFNLKLYANTPDEFNMIYKKINRLTSLCYPQYKSKNSMLRMKPPLTKLRIGELFGSQNNEMTGHIKSLSYTVPEESPWETAVNKRAPKYIIATISYQIIHGTVPQLHQQAYGLEEVEDEEGNTAGYIPMFEEANFIAQEGDRCDVLANQFYNDAKLWWFIARVNNLKTNNIPAGTSLRIPISSNKAKGF